MDEPRPDAPRADAAEREIEEVDALPVLDDDAPSAQVEPRRPPGQIVARQAAAVAATSFAAGPGRRRGAPYGHTPAGVPGRGSLGGGFQARTECQREGAGARPGEGLR